MAITSLTGPSSLAMAGGRGGIGAAFRFLEVAASAITKQEIAMHSSSRVSLFTLAAFACATTFAASMNGKLPMYPNGHNMNDMPASAIAMGVPMVLETNDSVQQVDAWYTANSPKSCARTTASDGIKYACDGGSIMIYVHGGKTQIAIVPSMSGIGAR